jgi:hypothetical protein
MPKFVVTVTEVWEVDAQSADMARSIFESDLTCSGRLLEKETFIDEMIEEPEIIKELMALPAGDE